MATSKLSADQRASLRLLLSGRTYADVANGLGLSAEEVRRKALEGLAALDAQGADRLAESERERVADYVLGQVDSEPLAEDSPAGSTYATSLLQDLAVEGIHATSRDANAGEDVSAPVVGQRVPVESNGSSSAWASGAGNTSRKGGAILLGGACLAAIVVVLFATGAFDSTGSKSAGTPAVTTNTGAETSGATGNSPSGTAGKSGGWTVRRAYNLKSVDSSPRRGVGAYETKGPNRSLVFAATGMPASAIAGIWLVGGPQPVLVGFQKTDAKGQFTAISSRVPDGADKANSVVITSEQYTPGGAVPRSPGKILLQAPFGL